MLEIFDEIVGPAAERFKPDIILVRIIQPPVHRLYPVLLQHPFICWRQQLREHLSCMALSEQIKAASHSFCNS